MLKKLVDNRFFYTFASDKNDNTENFLFVFYLKAVRNGKLCGACRMVVNIER